MDHSAGTKKRFEYDYVDLREKYDPELLKRYYDELMVPNFGVSFEIINLYFFGCFFSACVFLILCFHF